MGAEHTLFPTPEIYPSTNDWATLLTQYVRETFQLARAQHRLEADKEPNRKKKKKNSFLQNAGDKRIEKKVFCTASATRDTPMKYGIYI